MAKITFQSKIDLGRSLQSLEENEMLVITDEMSRFDSLPSRVTALRNKGVLDDRRITIIRDSLTKTSYAIRFPSAR